MKEKFRDLPLRSGVGIIVLNKENKVFVAKRIDNPKNFWQMPQGGVDEGEDFLTAAYRELEEETSIKKVEMIKEIDGTITYELPDHLLGIIWKGKYKGQKQKWFLMRFLGSDEEINIKTNKPEFLEWKWIDLDQIRIKPFGQTFCPLLILANRPPPAAFCSPFGGGRYKSCRIHKNALGQTHIKDRRTCGTDAHVGQTHMWDRRTCGTDAHMGQTHIGQFEKHLC